MPLRASAETIAAIAGRGDPAPARLGDALRNGITEAIIKGRLKPGDSLPSEAQIAASFGVSKQVAREAVREIAGLGLVDVRQGKATRVRALNAAPLGRFFHFAVQGSETGLAEAVELRRILEPRLARLAAIRRSDEDLAHLRDVYGRLEGTAGSVPSWIEADLDFHEAVAIAAGNRLARFQIVGLRPVIRQVMESFNSRERRGPADWHATLDRHARVLQAIESGDGIAAESAMSRHFEAADVAIAELFPRPQSGGAQAAEASRRSANSKRRGR